MLLIEVLSPSTATYDRGRTFDHYRTLPSLSEYLLVSQDEPRIDCFRREPDERWSYKVAVGLAATLPLRSIACTLALADVYHRVPLADAP